MKQIQRAGDNTNNYQANTINVTGVSYTEAKEIALDVFRSNAIELSSVARQAAQERVEEITDSFFTKLKERAPEAIQSVTDPGMQRAIFRVQEEFACSGDEVLGEVLVDMLVDRAKASERNIQQITMNEAIKTSPKLATHHFTILATLLLVGKTQFTNIGNLAALHERLGEVVAPVTEGLRVTESDLRHLQYAGCLSIDATETPISRLFTVHYTALFVKGFERGDIGEPWRHLGPPAIIPSIRDKTKLQVGALTKQVLQEDLIPAQGLEECTAELTRLMDLNPMTPAEVEEEISSLHPNLRELVNIWGSTSMRQCSLTSVGIAIGHANARRILGERFKAEINVWVN